MSSEIKVSDSCNSIKLFHICVVTAIVFGLYACSLYSYLIFHSLIEIATIAIAFSIFFLTWNTQRFQKNTFLNIVGIGYAFIAIIDLLHTLAYKGMNIFPGFGANLSTQLWIAARYMQAVTLCAAALLVRMKVDNRALLLLFSTAASAFAVMVLSGNFPDCYIDGKGLTVFKIYSEYVISALLTISMYLLYRERGSFSDKVFFLILSSIACTAASEISFTVYRSVYGFANMAGHYLKLAGFYLLYRAMFVIGLKQPFELIFRELREKEELLIRSNDILEERVRERTAELCASEKNLRRAQTVEKIGSWYVDLETESVQRSVEAARIFEQPLRTEILLSEAMDLVHPEDREEVWAVWQSSLATGDPFVIDHRVVVNGEIRWIREVSEFERDATGQVVGAIGTSQDITERKRSEEAIKLANAYNRGLIEASIDPFVTIGHDGRITDVNKATETVTGLPREGLIGRDFSDFFTDPAKARAGYQQVFREGSVHDYELEIRQADGHVFPVLYNATVYRDENGDVAGVFAAARDITERKRSEEAIKLANAYNRGLIEASIDPLVTIGHDGRITDVNSATEKVTGVSREGLIGKDFSDFFTDPDRAKTGYQMVFSESMVRDYELEIMHANGHVTPVLYNATVYRDESGDVAGVFAAARDISERRSLEEQLRQAQKMESLGTLTGGIAHEFNNILTAIIGYGYFLRSDLTGSPELLYKVEALLHSAERAAMLVRSLLSFSRKQISQLKPTDMNKLILEKEDMLKKIIRNDIRLELSLSGLPLVVMVDCNQIDQVFINLVSNAQDAMPKGGMISICSGEVGLDWEFIEMHGFGKVGRYALISFSDNGEGMDETVRQKIFEPFFTTKEVGKGTGLGLSVCYGIIKQHKGYVICESRKGIGTSFSIYLPLAEREPEKDKPMKDIPIGGGKETILIAEDNAHVMAVAQAVLERSGYRVIRAIDGKDALEKYRQHKEEIELVILDIIMPFMNGKEVYREISRLDPEMKVIFISGYMAEIMAEEEKETEGFVFISKPFDPKRLLEKVRNILNNL